MIRSRGNAARDDFVAQSLANRRDVIGAAQREALQRARCAVAQAAFARPAVVDGGVLPERADFVDDRNPALPPDPQCRQRVQHRRVRVQDVGAERRAELGYAPRGRRHLLHVHRAGHSRDADCAAPPCDGSASRRLPRRRRWRCHAAASSAAASPSPTRAARAISPRSGTCSRCAAAANGRGRGECASQPGHAASGSQRRSRRRVGDVAQEGVEHQQGPQRRAVVAAPGLMMIDQLLQIAAVEHARCRRGARRAAHRAPARAADRGTSAPAGPQSPFSAGTGSPPADAARALFSAAICLPGRAP